MHTFDRALADAASQAEPASSARYAPRVWARSPLHVVVPWRADADPQALEERLRAEPRLTPGQLHMHPVSRSGALPAVARRVAAQAAEDGGVLLACGGDGTVNTVARAAWEADLPFSVLPQGTFNYFSRAQGLGQQPEEGLSAVLSALADGLCRPVPVGLLDDQIFLVNASLGLYPRVLQDREEANRRFGRRRLVALLASVGTLLSPDQGQSLRLHLRGPNDEVQTLHRRVSTLFVGLNPLQLAQLGVQPGAAAQAADPAAAPTVHTSAEPPAALPFTTLMFEPQPRRRVLRLLLMALLRRLPQDPAVEVFAMSELEVDTDRPGRLGTHGPAHRLRVAFDGETRWMRLPLRVGQASRPLWLVAPTPGDPAASPPATDWAAQAWARRFVP